MGTGRTDRRASAKAARTLKRVRCRFSGLTMESRGSSVHGLIGTTEIRCAVGGCRMGTWNASKFVGACHLAASMRKAPISARRGAVRMRNVSGQVRHTHHIGSCPYKHVTREVRTGIRVVRYSYPSARIERLTAVIRLPRILIVLGMEVPDVIRCRMIVRVAPIGAPPVKLMAAKSNEQPERRRKYAKTRIGANSHRGSTCRDTNRSTCKHSSLARSLDILASRDAISQ